MERASQLTDESERILGQPRAEMTWTPPSTYKSFDTERMEKLLEAAEARVRKRMDAADARFNERTAQISKTFDALAMIAAEELGLAEKRLRGENTELRKEVESLRGELTLLRAQANVPARRPKDAASRAPFKISGENGNVRN